MKVIIIHNQVDQDADPDELDVLSQVKLVGESLNRMEHEHQVMTTGEDLYRDINAIRMAGPDRVINLVESVFGKNELMYMVPDILGAYGIHYTGAPAEAIYLTTNKVTAKRMMRQAGIPTPDWFLHDECGQLNENKPYIIKPVREDGSVGLDEDAVFRPQTHINAFAEKGIDVDRYFVEEYIPGREFNVSLLAGSEGPEVLPVAEIIFRDYPPQKVNVVGYKAKWDQHSFEYGNTLRQFNTLAGSAVLSDEMSRIALRCWSIFGLKGYGRIDFRVDGEGKPFVLEVNANPCISPDSGFIAAAEESGLSHEEVIRRMINDYN